MGVERFGAPGQESGVAIQHVANGTQANQAAVFEKLSAGQ